MKLNKKLEKLFLALIILPLVYMAYSWNKSNTFKNNPLNQNVQKRIKSKQIKTLSLIREKFSLNIDIPLIVSDEFTSNLYGLTSYKDGKITIYLNKKRFKESTDYMIEEVIAHEYAHAIVFLQGKKTSKDGHTPLWQSICFALDGKQCIQYVDNERIVQAKMGF